MEKILQIFVFHLIQEGKNKIIHILVGQQMHVVRLEQLIRSLILDWKMMTKWPLLMMRLEHPALVELILILLLLLI